MNLIPKNECEHEWVKVGAEVNQQCRWCSTYMRWIDLTQVENIMDYFWELQHDE